MTLTDFLLARIAEDKAAVREVTDRDPILSGDRLEWFADMDDLRVGLSPSRALAECEAKRRILAETRDAQISKHDPLDVALYHLAAVYSDHPDYRDEWKP